MKTLNMQLKLKTLPKRLKSLVNDS